MAGNKGASKELETFQLDYCFIIPTEKYGNIALGLVNHGQGLAGGKQVTDSDEKFHRLMGSKEVPGRWQVSGTSMVIKTDQADTILVNGESCSLSEVVEKLYSSRVDMQQAVEDGKPHGLKMVLSLLEEFAVGKPEQSRQRPDLQTKEQGLTDLANSVRQGLLRYGLGKGHIPQDYLIW